MKASAFNILVQHSVIKAHIPNQRNAYAVYLFECVNFEFRLAVLVTAIKAAKGVNTFKGNSTLPVFLPTDQTFTEL
ncbi:hypothetical protein [Nostoc sp.]|uniref:hypothetical protein n=1 Tax=Nostoc sp. TaxID=1180 RepID=UPI002FF7E94A